MLTPPQEIEILQSFGYMWLSKERIVKPVARHLLSYDTVTKLIVNVFKVDEKLIIYNSAILNTENYDTFVESLTSYEAYTNYTMGKGKPYNILLVRPSESLLTN